MTGLRKELQNDNKRIIQQTVMVMRPNDNQINLNVMTKDETEDDDIVLIFK